MDCSGVHLSFWKWNENAKISQVILKASNEDQELWEVLPESSIISRAFENFKGAFKKS